MRSLILLLLFFLWLPTQTNAQSLFTSAQSNADSLAQKPVLTNEGYLRTALYLPGNQTPYNALYADFAWKGSLKFHHTSLKTELRLRNGRFFNENRTELMLRAGWVAYTTNRLEIKAGNQIIRWGTGDGFNPTQNLCPLDYFNLSAQSDDQYLPNFLLSVNYQWLPWLTLEGIWIPAYKGSAYRYDLIKILENTMIAEEDSPDRTLSNSTLAGKMQGHFHGMSVSVSLFHGYDPLAGLRVKEIQWQDNLPTITLVMRPYRKTTLGTDFEMQIRSLILRGELAWNIPEENPLSAAVPAENLSYVFNMEKKLGEWTAIIQYIGMWSYNLEKLSPPEFPADPDPTQLSIYYHNQIQYESASFNRRLFYQQEKMNHAISIHLAKSFLQDDLTLQANAYFNYTSSEWMLRPLVQWNVTDALKLSAGYNFLYGEKGTLFDLTAPYFTNAFIEFKASY